jgi:fumarate reductase subunit C
MLRELSSVFVAVFVVELLFLVRAVAHGPAGVPRIPGHHGQPGDDRG